MQNVMSQPPKALTMPEYIRLAAGLGLAVRVYPYHCRVCGEKTAMAQAAAPAILADVPTLIKVDGAVKVKGLTLRHCGCAMVADEPYTRNGITEVI